MKVRGLSLRYKILLALTLLPVIGLSLFFLLAKNLFEKDKIAYVFDSSLSVSKTKAARVRSEVSSLISLTQSLVLSYKPDLRNLAESGTYFFEREKRFTAFQLFMVNPQTGKYERVVKLEKTVAADVMTTEEADFPLLIQGIRDRQLIVRNPASTTNTLLLGLRFGDASDPRHLISLSLFDARELTPSFATGEAFMSFLVQANGEAVYSPAILDRGGKEWTTTEIWKVLTRRQPAGEELTEGIAEIKAPSATPYLASYAPVGAGGMVVVSLVNKQAALEAVTLFIRQSLVFSIGIVALTLFISVVASRSLTSALSRLLFATHKVAEGDFNVRVQSQSQDEIGVLAKSFNKMAEEVARLMIETADKARMESELATAKTVQETLFPDARAVLGPVRIAGHYTPASECGGDWWYYAENDEQVTIWIADATGHGAPAALITSAARAVASVIQSGPPMPPSMAIQVLNRAICDTSKGKMMMTFFMASIDKRTGTMSYVNASHEAPMLIHQKSGEITKDDFVFLNEVNNPRLGENAASEFQEATIQLSAGDRIVFYTDGVTDVKSAEAKAWGERRFLKTLARILSEERTAEAVLDKLVTTLWEYRENTALDDDVTMIVASYDGAA